MAKASDQPLQASNLARQLKGWEKGDHYPDEFNRALIAKTFGTVTDALFKADGSRDGEAEVLAVSGMATLDIISRLRASDLNNSSIEALRITVDRLCSEYPHMPAEQLLIESRTWLNRLEQVREQRLTISQHREVLVLAGWLALLTGCVEYDLGERRMAESTRRAALSLGRETDNRDISGWANEMRAWFALTGRDYRGTITAARSGIEVAHGRGVSVQLAAQEAKAWARMGDKEKAEAALEQGRTLLESLPYPDNIDHHFVVDPAKFDFYAMDCYRVLGDTRRSSMLAEEVISAGTEFDGTQRSPMRIAEARITLATSAIRGRDLDEALGQGRLALLSARKSRPSLSLVAAELRRTLTADYGAEPAVREFLDELHASTLGPTIDDADG
jgi:hypothetical protein